jgi:pimeloyl-ACP methyl ester carboxylesterase
MLAWDEGRHMPAVHRYAAVAGQQLFFREAGAPDAPVVVLLHGFPTSSYTFRQLIPALADRYRVIAPDVLGVGMSDALSVDEFDNTFDALSALTAGLLGSLSERPRRAEISGSDVP